MILLPLQEVVGFQFVWSLERRGHQLRPDAGRPPEDTGLGAEPYTVAQFKIRISYTGEVLLNNASTDNTTSAKSQGKQAVLCKAWFGVLNNFWFGCFS